MKLTEQTRRARYDPLRGLFGDGGRAIKRVVVAGDAARVVAAAVTVCDIDGRTMNDKSKQQTPHGARQARRMKRSNDSFCCAALFVQGSSNLARAVDKLQIET